MTLLRLALSSLVVLPIACGGGSPASPSASTTTTTTTTPTTVTPSGPTFDSGGVKLSYAIDRPTGTGPFPGIVLVHEGGIVTKENMAPLAASLTARGFVVLRYDKRGTGLSGGAFEEVTVENSVQRLGVLAADVNAAVQTLKAATGVDAARLGLVGVSQAGWVMPIAATTNPDVKFVAAVVGPAIAVGPLYYFAGLAGDATKSFTQLSAQLAAYTGATGFDPRASLESLGIPMLYQLATDDRVVPYRESRAVLDALTARGKPVTVQALPGGHEVRETTNFVADLLTWLEARK